MNSGTSITSASPSMPSGHAIRGFAIGLAALGLVASLPASASAGASTDRDRDGLSAKVERRIGTNPHRADTDRDRLKDGVEVRLGTNPRRADTDRDGIRDDREVRARSNPRSADTDGDGIQDRYEYGLKGDADELDGTLAEIGDGVVTIADKDGKLTVVQVTSQTRLRAVDLDGDGVATLADFQVGDRVEAHTQPADSGIVALSLKNESGDDGDDDESGDDGDGEAGASEVDGVVSAFDGTSLSLTRQDGSEVTVQVGGSTSVSGPDRDGDGLGTPADIRPGDRVEIRIAAGSNVATSIKIDVGSHDDSEDRFEAKGTVKTLGSASITLVLRNRRELVLVVDSATRFEVRDRNGDGSRDLADFRVGDRVEAEGAVGGLLAAKLKLDD